MPYAWPMQYALCVVGSLRLTTLEFWVMDDVILDQKQAFSLVKYFFAVTLSKI
jgi:hypothetical protein